MNQLKSNTSFIKESLKYLGWILLFVFLWFNGCSDKGKSIAITKVTIPEVKGTFKKQKPTHSAIVINANNQANMTKVNPIDAKLITENEKLKKDYQKANDSIKKLQYYKAIQLNRFASAFENDDIKINFNGIVQGEVKEVTPTYTIKERKLQVPVKVPETKFRVLAGIELGNNTTLDDFKVKGNLMFQNKKGNILSTSFDTNQTIWVGYTISIINIKR